MFFKAETIDIPVENTWGDGINADIMNPVTANIYKVTEAINDNGEIIRNAELVNGFTLSKDNNWLHIVQGLQAPEEDMYYVIAEAVPPGYTVTYSGETVTVTDGDRFFPAVKLDGTGTKITMTNTVSVQLPSTGGGGIYGYTLGGMLVMIAALLLWYSFYLKRRREESPPL